MHQTIYPGPLWRNIFLCTLLVTAVSSGWATPLRAITTVAPLTDLVQHVAGDAIQLHGLVPAGMNSHTFQPTPGDATLLAEANIIFLNGLYLEVPTEKLARSAARSDVVLVKLGDETIRQADWLFDANFPAAQGHPNPHLWLNVVYAMHYTRLIRDHLQQLDPLNATLYTQNANRLLAQLQQLDQCVAAAIGTIPSPQRQLLTYHDSWPYFARRYGMTVIGAIQPASFTEPSPREVVRIIEQIRATQVPAIFGSAVFPSPVLNKIAQETGVQYINTLRDDTLPGTPGETDHSYIGMMVRNVTTMVRALGGQTTPLEPCRTALHGQKQR